MKRFALFQGDVYYPSGGWNDLKGSFDTKEEAIAAAKKEMDTPEYQWAHVVDLTDGSEVWLFSRTSEINRKCPGVSPTTMHGERLTCERESGHDGKHARTEDGYSIHTWDGGLEGTK